MSFVYAAKYYPAFGDERMFKIKSLLRTGECFSPEPGFSVKGPGLLYSGCISGVW